MMRVVAATDNHGKLAEMRALLAPRRLEVIAQSELGIAAADESGETFMDNAVLKARNACLHSGLAAIADDSGLTVDALGGAPGIYSARYAGDDVNDGANDEANDEANIDKLLAALHAVECAGGAVNRAAQFHCAMVYLRAAGQPPLVGEGVWRGVIIDERRGANGFGYDPVFYIARLGKTAAQLSSYEKNQISHRAQAINKLARLLPNAIA